MHKGLSATRNYKSVISLHVKLKWKMFAFCQSCEEMGSCHSPRVSQPVVMYEYFFCSHPSQFPLLSTEITPLMNYRVTVENLFLLQERSLRWFGAAKCTSPVHSSHTTATVNLHWDFILMFKPLVGGKHSAQGCMSNQECVSACTARLSGWD